MSRLIASETYLNVLVWGTIVAAILAVLLEVLRGRR